jgi:SCP-2 sterol transfer family
MLSDMARIHLSIDDQLLTRLDRRAAESGLTRSAYLAGLVTRELDRDARGRSATEVAAGASPRREDAAVREIAADAASGREGGGSPANGGGMADGEPGQAFDPVAAVRRLRDRWGETLGRPDLPDRLRRQGERAFAGLVRGRSDEQLDRLVGSGPMLRLVFRGMQQAFRPEKAGGFRGDVQYELDGRRGSQRWVISIDGEHATAWPGSAATPALTVRTDVATFARMVAGEVPAAILSLEGRIRVEGDPEPASRLGEMFGQASPW